MHSAAYCSYTEKEEHAQTDAQQSAASNGNAFLDVEMIRYERESERSVFCLNK